MRQKTLTAWLSMTLLLAAGLRAAGPDAAKKVGEPALAPGRVSVEVKPQEARLADPIELIIRVELPEGKLTYELPDKIPLDGLEEISRAQEDQEEGGKKTRVFRVKVAAYEKLGEITVAEFALRASGPVGEPAPELRVPEFKVKIRSLMAGLDKPQPRDIAGPTGVTVDDYRLLAALGIVVLWLLLTLALRLQRSAAAVPDRTKELPPPRLAHEIALEKLNGIVEENLLRKERVQEFFLRISETIREYVGNRYGFYALDLTTRELLMEMRDRHTPGMDHEVLSQLLQEADLVKFARLQPTDASCSRAINSAFALVEASRLPDEVKESA